MSRWSDAAEAAFVQFMTADVGALEPIALSLADDLDRRAFAATEQRARGAAGPARDEALAALAALGEKYRSPALFDVAIAGALDDAGEPERGLEARLRALPLTPSWHPDLAGRVLGNVGWSLAELGEPEAARRFFERTRTFDPVNPFALASLAEAEAKGGDAAWARGVRRWLDEHGFPAEMHAEALDRLLAERPGDDVTPFAPGFDGLRSLDARGYARLVACIEADRDAQPHARLRALALGAAMRGERPAARLWADEAARLGGDADENDAAWASAMAAWLEASGPSASPDPQARADAIDAAMESGEKGPLRAGLHDPIPALRAVAAEALGDADAVALLEELAAVEERFGVAARPPSAHGAAWALHRLRAKALGPWPVACLTSTPGPLPPLGAGEGLVAWMTFAQAVTAEDAAWLDARLSSAAKRIAADDPGLGVFSDQNPQTIQLVLRGAKQPDAAARALVEAFGGAGSRLAELTIGAFTLPDGAKRRLFAPMPSPGSKQVDASDPRQSAFDTSLPPPRSEPEGGPSFMVMQSEEGHVPEVRLAPIELADVRVAWGLADVDAREAGPGTAAGAREVAVRAAVDAALAAAFHGQPPARRSRAGEGDGALDAIRHAGRDGFAFALDGMCPAFVVHYPCGFRFRERELLAAMAEVTRAAGLAPVVQWERGGGTWLVNLWE